MAVCRFRRIASARRLLAGAVALPLLVALPLWAASAAGLPDIWFSPRAGHGPVPGVADFDTLFRADNPAWTSVESKIQAYTIGLDHVVQAPDEEVERMFSDLHGRHVKVDITVGALARLPGETCGIGEGYARPAAHQRLVDKLARLHLQPDIISLDSPLGFGSYHPRKCGFGSAALLQHLVPALTIYARAFPAATIGDIEGWIAVMEHPGWQSDYRAMKDGIAAATGVRLAFATTDLAERGHADWAGELATIPPFVHSLGMRYGVIYDGHGRDPTDEAWIASAKEKIVVMEDQHHIIPDYVVFATWNPHPTHALPETDPTTLSSLIDWYLARHH
jgi:hypothetical protein